MNKMKNKHLALLLMILGLAFFIRPMIINAQVQATERRYMRTGSLQTFYTSYGSERAYNNAYYEGLIWPADYNKQDNAVIHRAWIFQQDYTDGVGKKWGTFGTSLILDYCGISLFPVYLKQTSRFEQPTVYVDGSNVKAPYLADVDAIDPTQIADRVVTNVVNTVLGVTYTRKIYYFTQQYHDNYVIKVWTFKNTGNRDYDEEIESQDPVKGFRICWSIRYSCGWEGADVMDSQQEWGKSSWVTKRGETYASHYKEKITEANPVVDWLRCGFSWMGQSEKNTYDNIGAPWRTRGGRLTGCNHVGYGILHVDKGPQDPSDDPYQPNTLGWHAGDTYQALGDLTDSTSMNKQYLMVSGKPFGGEKYGGNNRFDETYMATNSDPYTVHGDGGGTNIWIAYGPWDLAFGDSIMIVEAEGVNGLSRQMSEKIGAEWLKAYNNSAYTGPFVLPNGQTTTNKDEYKNAWVYTGKDSILMSIGRAKRNFDSDFAIPQPPLPPAMFDVRSGGDRISLSWSASPSQDQPGFAGYDVYRAVGKPDTFFTKIYSAKPSDTKYDDVSAIRGFSYYYYIVSVNDGSNNTSGETNPTGPLYSNRFYTKTTEGAYLRRMAGLSLDDIRVVPNPYNIKARNIQYTGEKDKLMFLNIPGQCTIRIFTVSGDLVETINHTNGSGDQAWESVTSSNQVIVSGIYIAHFTVEQDQTDPSTEEVVYKKGETQVRRFIIVR